MRITGVHLKNYKRFTDLQIGGIPKSARLVVLVGPNGSGKSSVFDAFLLKSQSSRNNRNLRDALFSGYLLKDESEAGNISSTSQVANSVDIEVDSDKVEDWSRIFSIRSPYRHEADFANTNLGPTRPSYESPKPIPRWDVHFGEIDDDSKHSTAPHITFRPQLGGHQ